MAKVTISCAGDNQLAAEIYNHLCSKAGSGAANIAERDSLVEDEIEVDQSLLPKKAIRQILDSFIKLNPERLKGYRVVESGDIFIVGIAVEPSKIDGLLACEFCGYFTPYAEDLFVHKRMHAGGG